VYHLAKKALYKYSSFHFISFPFLSFPFLFFPFTQVEKGISAPPALHLFMAALCNRGGIIFCSVVSFYLPYLYTWRGPSANLECRSEMCCTRLAANTGHEKVAKNRHLCTIAQLCRAISSQIRHVSTIGKNWLSSNMSSTCPHNMVNFGPLAAEIVSLVWGTPANFNGFGVLAALLHGTLVVGVSQNLRR